MSKLNNFGILLRLDWNSNQWQDKPIESDIHNVNFDYVRENKNTHTYYNLNKNELLRDGFKYALAPQLTTKKPLEKVSICFFISNYKKKDFIVGYVINPDFTQRTTFENFPSDIIFNMRSEVDNFVPIQPVQINLALHLPPEKQLGKQGFNYLNYNNCFDLICYVHNRVLPDRIQILFQIKKYK